MNYAKNSALKALSKIKSKVGMYIPAQKKSAKIKTTIIMLLGLVALFAACTKQPKDYPPEPQIYHLSTTPNTINLNDTINTVRIELKFTDGDGDIGTDPNEEKNTVFIRDSRDTSTAQDYSFRYPFPYIEDYMRPTKGGLEGFITINLGKQYFSVSDSLHLALRKDTLHWDVYVMDDAGHKSNVVSSDPIYIEF